MENLNRKRKSNIFFDFFKCTKRKKTLVEPSRGEELSFSVQNKVSIERENEEGKTKKIDYEDMIIKLIPEKNTLVCPICLKYFVKAASTKCGHAFCDICIHEYFLYFKKCIICSENIRKFKVSRNISIDSIVKSLVEHIGGEESTDYQKRLEEHQDWEKNRKLEEIRVGLKIDVRDPNYVWCQGLIIKIHKKPKIRFRFAVIHYEVTFLNKGVSHRFDEEIVESSNRLAPRGFYTNRNDIPKYYPKNSNHHFKVQSITDLFPHENSGQENIIMDNISSSSSE